jgi:hypothetical protein
MTGGASSTCLGASPKWHNQICPPHADHSGAYRIGSQYIALVEQPYASPDALEDMRTGALGQSLTMTIPDWPSWWFPGWTTLCVFTLPKVASLIEAAVGHGKTGLPILLTDFVAA